MTNRLMEGFDLYNTASDLALRYTGSSEGFSTTAGRFGGGAFVMGGVGLLNMPLPTTATLELWLGFAYQITSTRNSDAPMFSFQSPAGYEGQVSYNPTTGQIKVWRGNQSTFLTGVTASLSDSHWHWWDVHYKADASSGIWEVWVDGNQLLTYSGGNTLQSGGSNLSVLVLGSTTSNTVDGYVDDIVVNDTTGTYNNGRVGDSRIETIVPTSDAGPNNGTPSTGTSHYAVVDEAQFNTTDYITMTNTSGQEELFGMGSLSGTPASIAAVQLIAVAENDSAGSGSLEMVVSSSGSVANGSSISLGTTWGYLNGVFESDPHTSAAWTAASVNALKAGFKVP